MQRHSRLVLVSIALSLVIAWAWMTQISWAYVEAPMSLGAIVTQSSNIVLMRVETVDKDKNIIIYRKIRDVKGKHPQDVVKHNIGRGGLRANEWKPQMDWAEPGKTAVFFYNGGASETCIGNWWYQAYGGGEWWNHSHAEPFLLRSFAGSPDKLAAIVDQMLLGQEVAAPCMIDGDKEDLHNRRAKIQRVKVSLKIQDYNPKRDFLGWGGEDFRRLLGMPGFTHISPVGRVDPEAQAISVIDFDGDGKQDLCLVGGNKVMLLQNSGETMSESMLAGVSGARSAVWADYNGDGKPDLLLATPSGLKLFTNLGPSMRDDSHLLPPMPMTVTAAAWLDYDGDGKPDLLVAHGYHGLRLYRNVGVKAPATPKGPVLPAFEDVSDKVGLGSKGIGADLKGDSLTVTDVNGDGRPDFLYGAGTGLLVLSSKNDKGEPIFVEAKNSGISFMPGKINPVFGDFDNDGHPDLLVPQKNGVKLFKNDGKGKFTDVTEKAGDLAKANFWATSAAWGDVDNDGHLDLVVGCLKGSNRYFRNKGNGTFDDATEAIGLNQKIFNTQAVTLVDLQNRGVLDFIFNNEGQDSVVLLGNPTQTGKRIPLTLTVGGKEGITGSLVELLDMKGERLGTRHICGGSGRGGQQAPVARFTLDPGQYRVNVRLSSGALLTKNITLGNDPMRSRIDEPAKAAKAE